MNYLFVTLTFSDAAYWPALNHQARSLGATAAVLQGSGPGLITQLDELSLAGCTSVTLIGVTLGDAGVPTSWIGHVSRWWLANNPDTKLKIFVVSKPLRELPTALPDLSEAKQLRANPNHMTNPTWEQPPPVKTHLLVCMGPRCVAKGAAQSLSALGEELHRCGRLSNDVLITQTGCLYPCNQAPVVCAQPDMAWYGPLYPDQIPTFIATHLPSKESRKQH